MNTGCGFIHWRRHVLEDKKSNHSEPTSLCRLLFLLMPVKGPSRACKPATVKNIFLLALLPKRGA